MKIKCCLFILLAVLITFALVWASGWLGPNNYSSSHTFSHNWGTCKVYPRIQWYQYWDSGKGYFTKYKIKGYPSGSRCQIYVASNSRTIIKKEKAWLLDYRGYGVPPPMTWYDYVRPGKTWLKYYPNSDKILTKPRYGSQDGTTLYWGFVWNYVIGLRANPTEYMTFYFRNRRFLWTTGC